VTAGPGVESFEDLVDRVGANLARARERITSAGGDLNRVRIVAVTKGFGVEAVRAALLHGLSDIGENYADELVAKAAAVESPVTWHFHGALQTNKINRLKPFVSWWHTVDSTDRLAALAVRVPGARVLIQVDLAGTANRSGCRPDDVGDIVARARDLDVSLRGVMGVAPLAPSTGTVSPRQFFDLLASLADRFGLPERSMGMSDDLEDAVRAGSTMLRLGSALFGPRVAR
jgi:PLP dependent protein